MHKLPVILVDSEIVVDKVSPTAVLHIFIVMCNYYKLKVTLLLTNSNNSVRKTKQSKISVSKLVNWRDELSYFLDPFYCYLVKGILWLIVIFRVRTVVECSPVMQERKKVRIA